MNDGLHIVVIQFANEIDSQRLVKFRGAVVAALEEKDILFHNHDNDRLRYAYPLIQYKCIHGKAAVVGIGKGVDVITNLLDVQDFHFSIGKETVEMKMEAVKSYDNEILLTEKPTCRYRLRNWLPLNTGNYAQFQNAVGLVERVMMLEDVLTGNILSFLKGNDIYIDRPIEVHITDIKGQHGVIYKKLRLMAFDIEFRTNISLPQYIGLGKSASVGYGVVTKITNKTNIII